MDQVLILTSFTLSCFIIIFSQKYFLKNNFIDKIKTRSSHSSIATRTGGISIFSTLFLISIYFYFIGYDIYEFSLLIPLSLLTCVGLYDDINGVDYKLKFIFQIIAAKIIIDNGLIIDNLHGFAGIYEISRVAAQILTVFIIVAIINSINFIDGIDGLAITEVIKIIILIEFFSGFNNNLTSLGLLTIFSLLPLYYFNFKKTNKVFLGDGGSLLLGTLVMIYLLNVLSDNLNFSFGLNKLYFIIIVVSYPLFDLIRVFLLRIFKGKSPFIADQNHLHHIILKKTRSQIKTLFTIELFSIIIIILLLIIAI